MKTLIFFSYFIVAIFGLEPPILFEDGVKASTCSDDVCKIDDGCRCSTSQSPLNLEDTPQLISLTFAEALTEHNYNLWNSLLTSRVNPDGKPIGATFFIPHEYTDYQKVNNLYNLGYEIAVHSITNSALSKYWPLASEETLRQEFGGQKIILSKFANISKEDIIGVRTPTFEFAGNTSIKAYVKSEFYYDSTWPTGSDKPLFPYTLDYLSTEECFKYEVCPNEAFKGFWVLPIVEIKNGGRECYIPVSCDFSGTADEIASWLLNEIEHIRTSTKVPLTLIIPSYWFEVTDNSLEGLTKFLDKLTDYNDVFIVSQKQVLDWIKNPVPLSKFKTEFPVRNAVCTKHTCQLKKENDDKIMNSCVPCPDVYPWLGNPEGNST